jgi:glyoxylase-like metal-dependent hydrolase (beta-lactamase superfamily II)
MSDKTVHKFVVGSIVCAAILDGISEATLENLFANVSLEIVTPVLARDNLRREDSFVYPNTCLLVSTGGHRLLVDTGFGDIEPGCGKLLSGLQELGVEPKDIDIVVLSHAHGDHISGNTDAEGRIVFPNADWVMAKDEWNFWTVPENLAHLPPIYTDIARRQLPPIAKRLTLVDRETELVPGVFAVPLPGHTPGHMVVAVRSDGRELLYTADAMLHPLHVEHPEWCALEWADFDWEGVTRSRRQIYARAVAEDALVLAFHFHPFPSLGYIRQAGDGWRWETAQDQV